MRACLGWADDSNISCISRQPAQKGRGCLTAETEDILTLPSRQKDCGVFYIYLHAFRSKLSSSLVLQFDATVPSTTSVAVRLCALNNF